MTTEMRWASNEVGKEGKVPSSINALALLPIRGIGELIAEIDSTPPPRWLFRPVWPEGDYGVLGAEEKAGKTWAVCDAAVSVASGTPWLGVFPVESPGAVLIFLGEGGRRKIVRRLEAIAASRHLDLSALPIRICGRAPHFKDEAMMMLVEEEVARTPPQLLIVDPLYLAARGAQSNDLINMGEHLERIQMVAQRASMALLITHHWNQTGTGKGTQRFSGAGAAAWGRVLVSAAVVSRAKNESTGETVVTLELLFRGDEIADTVTKIRRRVWSDDPNSLSTPLHYEVIEVPCEDQGTDEPPSVRRVRAALQAARGEWLTIKQIGDAVARDGQGPPLMRPTISKGIKTLASSTDRPEIEQLCEKGSSKRVRWVCQESPNTPFVEAVPSVAEDAA